MARPRHAGRGEGSIYQRKSDGRWVASFLPDGERKRRYFYGKTRKEAYEKLQKALQAQKQGTLTKGRPQTVKQFLEHWLEDVHKEHVRLNTYRIYRQYLEKHVFPVIGHIQLQKLSPEHIQELYALKLKEGYAAETVRGIHRMLHKAFEDAVNWNKMSYNVCGKGKVKQPRPVKYEAHPLTKEQAKQLLQVAKGGLLEGLITLAVATGMRRGELLGLRWHDINFDEGSLQVRHTMDRAGRYGIIEGDPKTEKSKRRIFLPQFVLEALKIQRIRQLEAKEKAGSAWQERDIVFSNELGGFTEPTHLNRRFKKLLADAELPDMRFHDLRHSAATILLGMGVNPKLVQELLGHSQIAVTMDRYSHVLPSMQKGMMGGLDDFFGEE